ncbi:MAG: hypothetical protein ACPGUD_00615 [Parashewanella sp.]
MDILEKDLETLLEQLCSELGFCLPKLVKQRLIKYSPKKPKKFANTIVIAEGLDPLTMDSELYSIVLNRVKTVYRKYT